MCIFVDVSCDFIYIFDLRIVELGKMVVRVRFVRGISGTLHVR